MQHTVGLVAPPAPHHIVGLPEVVAHGVGVRHRLKVRQQPVCRVRQHECTTAGACQHRPDDPGHEILAAAVAPRRDVHKPRELIAHAHIAACSVPHELDRRVRYDVRQPADCREHVRAVDQPRVSGDGQRVRARQPDHKFLQLARSIASLRFDSQSASSSLAFLSYQPAALLLAVRSSRYAHTAKTEASKRSMRRFCSIF